ncbi:MAG: DinB family protein [Chitinophagales bacterium]
MSEQPQDNQAFLAGIRAEVKTMIHSVETQFATLSSEQLNRKATPEKWSIAECLEHLNIYSRYYNKTMKERLAKATPQAMSQTVSFSWIDKMSLDGVNPATMETKKTKTLKRFNPTQSKTSPTVLSEFLAHQADLLQILAEAENYHLNKIKIPVEFFKLMRLTLGGCLQFMFYHQKRHLIQAENVLKSFLSKQ